MAYPYLLKNQNVLGLPQIYKRHFKCDREREIVLRRERESWHKEWWNSVCDYFSKAEVSTAHHNNLTSEDVRQKSCLAFNKERKQELKRLHLDEKRKKLICLLQTEAEEFKKELQNLTNKNNWDLEDVEDLKQRVTFYQKVRRAKERSRAENLLLYHWNKTEPSNKLESKCVDIKEVSEKSISDEIFPEGLSSKNFSESSHYVGESQELSQLPSLVKTCGSPSFWETTISNYISQISNLESEFKKILIKEETLLTASQAVSYVNDRAKGLFISLPDHLKKPHEMMIKVSETVIENMLAIHEYLTHLINLCKEIELMDVKVIEELDWLIRVLDKQQHTEERRKSVMALQFSGAINWEHQLCIWRDESRACIRLLGDVVGRLENQLSILMASNTEDQKKNLLFREDLISKIEVIVKELIET